MAHDESGAEGIGHGSGRSDVAACKRVFSFLAYYTTTNHVILYRIFWLSECNQLPVWKCSSRQLSSWLFT